MQASDMKRCSDGIPGTLFLWNSTASGGLKSASHKEGNHRLTSIIFGRIKRISRFFLSKNPDVAKRGKIEKRRKNFTFGTDMP